MDGRRCIEDSDVGGDYQVSVGKAYEVEAEGDFSCGASISRLDIVVNQPNDQPKDQ